MNNSNGNPIFSSLVMGGFVFVSTSFLLLVLTWPIGSDWGTFYEHLAIIGPALWELLREDRSAWNSYWGKIEYENLQWDFILHTSLPLILALAFAIVFYFLVYHSSPLRGSVRHISGPVLLEGKRAIRHAAAYLRAELRENKQVGVSIHPDVPITVQAETGGLKVTGQHGAGKSVIIIDLLAQVIPRGDKILIFDEKRELTSLFYSEAAVLVSAPDARSVVWDIATDAYSVELAWLCAGQLIISDTADPFWAKGARLVLAGCICALNETHGREWGWPDLLAALSWPHDVIEQNMLKFFPIATKLIKEESKTTDGFYMAITTDFGWVALLAELWPKRGNKSFSIKEWVTGGDDRQVVIIPDHPLFSPISKPMCATFLSLMTAHVLGLPDCRKRRIWFCLDEFASLPQCPAIHDWLTKGRSKGARTLAGFQSFSQLEEKYGDKMAQTIASLFTNVIGLRCGASGGSAERAAAEFGARQIERSVVTVGSDGSTSTTYHREEEPLVRATDLVHLPQPTQKGVEGYLCIGGSNAVYRLRWPFPTVQTIAADFIPSKRLSGGEEPKVELRSETDRKRKRKRS